MGLDMYLEGDKYVGGHWEFRNPTGGLKIEFHENPDDAKEVTGVIEVPAAKISCVTMPLGYWRKANAIHKWFVDNVQGGKDECQRSYVTHEELAKLRELCQTVLDNVNVKPGDVHTGTRYTEDGGIEELFEEGDVITNPEVCEEYLPTSPGFFFGSIGYDEFYLQDLRTTIKIIDDLPEDCDLYYRASW